VTFFDGRWIGPFSRRPVVTLTVAFVLVAVSLLTLRQTWFDFDLLNLQPRDVDSVRWQHRVSEVGDESIWSAVSVCSSLEQAKSRTEQFHGLKLVSKVLGIGLLFPPDDAEKVRKLKALKQSLGPALSQVLGEGAAPGPGQSPSPQTQPPPDLITQVSNFRPVLNVAMLGGVPAEVKPALDKVGAAMDRLLAAVKGLDSPERQRRLSQLRDEYERFQKEKARQIARMLDTAPLELDDLPQELRDSYVSYGPDGKPQRFALEIHPELAAAGVPDIQSPLDPRFLPDFIHELEEVDVRITGVIVQIYESGNLIFTSYKQAGIYAFIVVFVLVLIDFRKLQDAVLSLVPVAAGFAVTFAVMWLLRPWQNAIGIPMTINAANIIVLPLMFGIGVDSGVHIIHRYRMDPTGRPLGLTHGTGKGITITSFTTMIGFGAMMLARHRGIASLGFTLTVGIGMTLLACWTIMPAWLELRQRFKGAPEPETVPDNGEDAVSG
jgi:uncharacterized protein